MTSMEALALWGGESSVVEAHAKLVAKAKKEETQVKEAEARAFQATRQHE